ncbi:30S ribosomal protein [Salix suchowensis]|nr:30S ribosomal protein [Salix suchowensis]
MTTISSFPATTNILLSSHPSTSTYASKVSHFSSLHPSLFSKSPSCPYPLCKFPRKPKRIVFLKSSEAEEISSTEDEWLQTLPDKKKPLYSHSLPCIEAWLKDLGFYQSKESRAIWFVEKPDWHAQLSLDATDLYIRYMKNGPGNLEKDVERRFSYALSREDIENATLGGP